MAHWRGVIQPFREFLNENHTIENETSYDDDCEEPYLKDTLFYEILVSAGCVFLVFFACFSRCRKCEFKFCCSLPYPMDLFTKDRVVYLLAFGTAVNLLFNCIFDGFRIIEYNGFPIVNTLIVLLSVLVFGVAHFPVFASLVLSPCINHVLGLVYLLFLLVLQVLRLICRVQKVSEYKSHWIGVRVGEHLPSILCTAVLIIITSYRLYKSRKDNEGCCGNHLAREEKEKLQDLQASTTGKYVMGLFYRRACPEVEDEDERCCCRWCCCWLGHKIHETALEVYNSARPFRYSTRFLATMCVSVILLYTMALQTFVAMRLLNFVLIVDGDLELYLRSFDFLPDDKVDGLVNNAPKLIMLVRVSIGLALTCCLISIVVMMVKYRENITAINKGKMKELWQHRTKQDFLAGAIRYSGHQVVGIVWGFIVQIIVFAASGIILAGLVGVITQGRIEGLRDNILIPLSCILGVYSLQRLVVRYLTKYGFTEKGKPLVIKNRRVMYITAYFMFFSNMYLGIVSAVGRLLHGVLCGAIVLPRHDTSLLPGPFASWDSVHHNYIGFLKLESDYMNPVMLTFVRLLNIVKRDVQMETLGGRRHVTRCDLPALCNNTPDKGESKPSPENARCLSCGQTNQKVQTCSRCKAAFYCNEDCQKKNWARHRGACDDRIKRLAQYRWRLAFLIKTYPAFSKMRTAPPQDKQESWSLNMWVDEMETKLFECGCCCKDSGSDESDGDEIVSRADRGGEIVSRVNNGGESGSRGIDGESGSRVDSGGEIVCRVNSGGESGSRGNSGGESGSGIDGESGSRGIDGESGSRGNSGGESGSRGNSGNENGSCGNSGNENGSCGNSGDENGSGNGGDESGSCGNSGDENGSGNGGDESGSENGGGESDSRGNSGSVPVDIREVLSDDGVSVDGVGGVGVDGVDGVDGVGGVGVIVV